MVIKQQKLTPDPDIQDWQAAIHRFKHLPRQTWVTHFVPQGETVAAHTVGVMLRALNLALSQGIPLEDVLLYALIHDLPETITGDLTLGQKTALGNTAVAKAEAAAWKQLLAVMPRPVYDRVVLLLKDLDPQVKKIVQAADTADLDDTARQYGVDLR